MVMTLQKKISKTVVLMTTLLIHECSFLIHLTCSHFTSVVTNAVSRAANGKVISHAQSLWLRCYSPLFANSHATDHWLIQPTFIWPQPRNMDCAKWYGFRYGFGPDSVLKEFMIKYRITLFCGCLFTKEGQVNKGLHVFCFSRSGITKLLLYLVSRKHL